MNIIQRIASALRPLQGASVHAPEEARAVELPIRPGERFEGGLLLSGGDNTITVTEETAAKFTAVYRAVTVLADTVAQLPFELMRRNGNAKERAYGHPLYARLHDLPNPEMTSFDMRHAQMAHVLLWGNSYSEIELNARGDVVALWPLPPWRTTPRRIVESRQLVFDVRLPGGGVATLPSDLVWRWHGLSYNGLTALSPIAYYRNVVENALSALTYSRKLYTNSARPSGLITHPGQLSPEARENLKKSWDAAHSGLDNAYRTALLEEGVKWEATGMPPEDAQFIQTMQFSIAEASRIFGVPLHMLSELSRATFSNIDAQGQEYLNYSAMAWLKRIEQSVSRDLIGKLERETLYAKFNVNGLLRGDVAARSSFYHNARMDGWMNADDIRALEDMNPLPNGEGEDYWQPSNMVGVGAPLSSQSDPNKRGRPREMSPLTQEQRDFAIRALQLRGDGKTWGEIEAALPGCNERTLRRWVRKVI